MGQILSHPVTEKHSEDGKDKYLAYGLSCMQGWRINMEDSHATILDLYNMKNDGDEEETKGESSNEKHIAFFGVYDGHGGEKAAIFTGDRLHDIIKSTEAFNKKDYINALKEGFLSCDQAILQDSDMKEDDSGCAATSAIITPSQIICGNAGDSRTIMSINGFAKALSYDHKPSNEGEKARISCAGGYVDMGRVNGNLALSRGIGDFEFKKNIDLPAEEQIVTCYPDVIQHNIDFEQDEFVVLACDGIWDCLTSQNCVECVRRGIYENKSLTTICEEIMELCCAPTSDGSGIGCDNMSIAIVALLDYSKNETLDDWYKKINKKIESQLEQEKNNDDKIHYGSISAPYNEIYKEMFGSFFEIGQQGANSNPDHGSSSNNYSSMFGGIPGLRGNNSSRGMSYDDNEEPTSQLDEIDEKDADNDDPSYGGNGAISLQKLIASNAITNENGVIYLDTSSAQSLLAHFGMSGVDDDADDENHHKHIEEEVDDEDNDNDHDHGSDNSQSDKNEDKNEDKK